MNFLFLYERRMNKNDNQYYSDKTYSMCILRLLINKRGFSYCNLGTPSWGIAWYINDLLIPEITVERGQTYTFIVEGGDDSSNPAR
jgi:hypothetical protein